MHIRSRSYVAKGDKSELLLFPRKKPGVWPLVPPLAHNRGLWQLLPLEMFLPVAANVGLRLSITVIAPLAFAFRPAGPLFVRRRHLSICKMVAASPSGVFSSAKDARAFVAESVLATGDIIKCGELACQINSRRR